MARPLRRPWRFAAISRSSTPSRGLFGAGPVAVATVEMWSRRMDLGLLLSVAAGLSTPASGHGETRGAAGGSLGEAKQPRALEILKIMDDQLASRRFLAGEHYSVADITGLVAIDFMKPARIERP